jgi:hypothetical protein
LIAITSATAAKKPVALPEALPRPDAAVGPTKIWVAIWLTDISKIDSVGQTFSATAVFFLRWHDSQLAHSGPTAKQYPLDDVWHPDWVIVNETAASSRALPERVMVTADGTVTYHQRLVGTFAQVLDLRHFPFDRDTFRIHFVVAGYRPEEIQFVPEETAIAAGLSGGAGIAPQLSLQDWRVLSHTTRTLPYRVAPGVEIAGYAFEFSAARNSWHFNIKVLIPLLLIVMMSWAVFWIEPKDNGPQFSIATTAMLTLIAYRFALDVEVPKLPYMTRLDAFVLTSTFLVFLSMIEVLVTTKLATANRMEVALKIDRCARWLAPAIFVTVSLAIFLRP